MDFADFDSHRRQASTPLGEVSYVEVGEGPPALFVHGVFLGAALWKDVIAGVADQRRCIAVDLPGHGRSPGHRDQPLTLPAMADLLGAFCRELELEPVDVVANDTGGAVAQVFTVRHRERVRSLTLTNCDVHTNLPPELFAPAVERAQAGELAPTLADMANDLDLGRTAGLSLGLEHPEKLEDAVVQSFLGHFADLAAGREIERMLSEATAADLVAIQPQLAELDVPTLVVWGTGDPFFGIEWAHWLRDTIPGVREVVEVPGAKLFFPGERAEDLIPHLAAHWEATEAAEAAA